MTAKLVEAFEIKPVWPKSDLRNFIYGDSTERINNHNIASLNKLISRCRISGFVDIKYVKKNESYEKVIP